MAELQLLGAGVEKDPIAAYMWYLLAEKTNMEMREKIAADKRKLAETLSTEQILEAQRRASEKLTSEIVEAFNDSTGELHKPPLA
jgi:hypothetical protein